MAEANGTCSEDQASVIVDAKELRTLIVKILEQQGMFGFEADMSADRMIEADLRGATCHGVGTMGKWIERIAAGDVDPRAQTVTMTETPAMAVLDVNKGMGQVGPSRAMKMAIKKAKEVGTATVAAMRGHESGLAANYAMMAADAGMIGYFTSSCGPATVSAPGTAQPATANHANAWAVPVTDAAPIVFESHSAKLTWSDVAALKEAGQTLVSGAALDADGNATTDPASASTLLPVADSLGFGFGLISSVLTGPLVGRKAPIEKTRRPESEGYEHFCYVLNISHFTEPETFQTKLAAALELMRGLPPRDGAEAIEFPGQSEWECSQRRKTEGIPLPDDVAGFLSGLASKKGIDVPW